MLIRYKGGRTIYDVSLNRKSHVFNKENNRTLDIKDQTVINYIFGLPNHQEFEAVEYSENQKTQEPENKENNLKCKHCDFIAKTELGLIVHSSSKHKKQGGK